MKTLLSPQRLAELHSQGKSHVGRFVNPHTIAACTRILRERGEEWAASVLMHDVSRRSLINVHFPWLNSGEEEILVLADAAEWDALIEGAK